MKDLEMIIPMLREFLDERGLNDVNMSVMLMDVPVDIFNETHSSIESKDASNSIGKQSMKICKSESDDIVLFSKYF